MHFWGEEEEEDVVLLASPWVLNTFLPPAPPVTGEHNVRIQDMILSVTDAPQNALPPALKMI